MTKDAGFESRKKHAIEIMAEKGMWSSSYAPPLHRLLWKLGVNLPPPPFASFWVNVFTFGSMYAIPWGMIMWFITWKNHGATLTYALITSLMAGLLFGVLMALFHYRCKKANKLPEWNQL